MIFCNYLTKCDTLFSMKKLYIKIACILSGILLITSCSPQQKQPEKLAGKKALETVEVLAVTEIIKDLVSRVGGEHVHVQSLIMGDIDPHSYELVKGDAEKFFKADLVVANGLQLEHNASLMYQLQKHPNVIFLGNLLRKDYPDQIIYLGNEMDPHVWMDISLWKLTLDYVEKALIQLSPKWKKDFQQNAQETRMLFQRKDQETLGRIQKIPLDRRCIVTTHDSFNYHVRRYFSTDQEKSSQTWKKRVYGLQGLAPDQEVSLFQIRDLVNYLLEKDMCVVFPEINLNQDALLKVQEICYKKGKNILLAKESLYGDTLGPHNYLDMMDHNTSVFVRYLGEDSHAEK